MGYGRSFGGLSKFLAVSPIFNRDIFGCALFETTNPILGGFAPFAQETDLFVWGLHEVQTFVGSIRKK